MREFRQQIFMGNQWSGSEAYKLMRRLMHGLDEKGGLEQLALDIQGDPKHVDGLRKEAEREIEDVVQDIAMALTGKTVEFRKGKT